MPNDLHLPGYPSGAATCRSVASTSHSYRWRGTTCTVVRRRSHRCWPCGFITPAIIAGRPSCTVQRRFCDDLSGRQAMVPGARLRAPDLAGTHIAAHGLSGTALEDRPLVPGRHRVRFCRTARDGRLQLRAACVGFAGHRRHPRPGWERTAARPIALRVSRTQRPTRRCRSRAIVGSALRVQPMKSPAAERVGIAARVPLPSC